MAQSPLIGTTQPVEIEEEGRSPTTDKHWLRYRKQQQKHHYTNGSFSEWFIVHPIKKITLYTSVLSLTGQVKQQRGGIKLTIWP